MFEWKKSAGKIYTLPVESIRPSPFQARTVFDEKELAGLAQSIRENGLLQPISVRKVEGGYELVAGERRLRACKLAKMETIPSIVCNFTDQRTARGLAEKVDGIGDEAYGKFDDRSGVLDLRLANLTAELRYGGNGMSRNGATGLGAETIRASLTQAARDVDRTLRK